MTPAPVRSRSSITVLASAAITTPRFGRGLHHLDLAGLGLALGLVLGQRASSLQDGVGHPRGDQAYRPDGVVVAGDREVDAGRVAVRVHDGHDGDAEALGLGHRDVLLAGVDDEDRRGQRVHHLDADQRLLELLALASSCSASFFDTRSNSPVSFISSSFLSRAIDLRMVVKLVRVPPASAG